jgi:hypothetical protein
MIEKMHLTEMKSTFPNPDRGGILVRALPVIITMLKLVVFFSSHNSPIHIPWVQDLGMDIRTRGI